MVATPRVEAKPLVYASDVLISADSHVLERPDIWASCMPTSFWPNAGSAFRGRPGGFDPEKRLEEMAQDGLFAEVLYPSLGLKLYGLEPQEADLQERAFRVYNDWMVRFCATAPERLIGIGLISAYDIAHAVKELERCHRVGLRGALVWEAPHPTLPFISRHYDPLWEAAQALGMPVSMHILSGHNYSKNPLPSTGLEFQRFTANKLMSVLNAVYDLIFSGALERYPGLKLVLVENEIGWLPWVLQTWNRYYRRTWKPPIPPHPLAYGRSPSDYFRRQIYATFFEDAVGASMLGPWGVANCMWSNDYPHENSTWPHSREVIARELGHLSPEDRKKVVTTNAARLYKMALPVASPP